MDAEVYNQIFRLIVADNKGYMLRLKHQHEDRDGEFLQTTNWLRMPLPLSRFPTPRVRRGEWMLSDRSHYYVRDMFDPSSTKLSDWLLGTWCWAMSAMADGLDLLGHPAAPKPERTFWLAEEPILDCGTVSHADNKRILDTVEAGNVGAAMVGYVGDGQTYVRTLEVMIMEPERYGWVLLLTGDWHFLVHALIALVEARHAALGDQGALARVAHGRGECHGGMR